MHIFSGTHKGRPIASPKGLHTRPTTGRVREALFNICQGYIHGANFLDLFAGSGAMGLEALSRGAKHVTFIDNDREAVKMIQKNLADLGFTSHATVWCGDVLSLLPKLEKNGKNYQIIYADPPYELPSEIEPYSFQLLRWLDQSNLLAESGELFLEESSSLCFDSLSLQKLSLVSERRMGKTALYQYLSR